MDTVDWDLTTYEEDEEGDCGPENLFAEWDLFFYILLYYLGGGGPRRKKNRQDGGDDDNNVGGI